MKLTIDRGADALYLVLEEGLSVISEEVSPGIIVDCDVEKRVVGIEMLHLSKRSPNADVHKLLFETIEATVPH